MPLLDMEPKPISNPEGTPQTLIHDPKVRQQILLDKQAKVLQWLKTEIYSSGSLLGQVMGVTSRQAVHKTLARMLRAGLVRAAQMRTLNGRETLWGITEHGQAMAFDPNHEKEPSTKVFQPGEASTLRLKHLLTLQAMKMEGLTKGWTAWRNCDREVRLKSRNDRQKHRADVIAIHPAGRIIAIELELTFKSVKRYAEGILPDHVRYMYIEDQYQQVLWVCPSQQDESRMRKLLDRALEQMKKKDPQAASRYDAYREQSGVKNVFLVSSLEQWSGLWESYRQDRTRNLRARLWAHFGQAASKYKDLDQQAEEEKAWLTAADHPLIAQTLSEYKKALWEHQQAQEAKQRQEAAERRRQEEEAECRRAAEQAAREEEQRRANSVMGRIGKLLGG